MVKLRNLEKIDSTVRCDIFPEDSLIPGMVIADSDGRIIKYELPAGYEWCENHVYHAAYAIKKMFAEGSFPKERNVAWG